MVQRLPSCYFRENVGRSVSAQRRSLPTASVANYTSSDSQLPSPSPLSGPINDPAETPEYSMIDIRPDFDWITIEDDNRKQGSAQSPFASSNTSNQNAHQNSTGLLQPQLGQSPEVFTQNPDSSGSPQVFQSSFLANPIGSHTAPGHSKVQSSNNSPVSTDSKPFRTSMPHQIAKAQQSLQSLKMGQIIPPTPNNRAFNVLRKPSLYAIPTWPPSATNQPYLTQIDNANAQSDPSERALGMFHNSPNSQGVISTTKRPYSTVQFETVERKGHSSSASVTSTASTAQNEVQNKTLNEDEDQPPRKRIRRRHAQNL